MVLLLDDPIQSEENFVFFFLRKKVIFWQRVNAFLEELSVD